MKVFNFFGQLLELTFGVILPETLGAGMAKKEGRVGEHDIRNVVLEIIRNQPNREITTTKLISELRKVIPLSPDDEEQLEGRNDDRFSQIVRNIKSHKDSPGNLIYDGHLLPVKGGFKMP